MKHQNKYKFIFLFFGLASLALHQSASGQECENVIALSKTRSVTVSDQSTVEQHAANFCNEYAKASGSSSATNFGASYKFLAASFGQSNASAEQVASRYCSANQTFKSANDAYKQYVEAISPNSYNAYSQCISMSQRSVRFNIDPASILPDEFTLSVSFASDVAESKSANFAYSAPKGVSCNWDATKENSITVNSGATEILKCSRDAFNKRAYVTIVRKDGGNSMTLPWPAYGADGVPVDQVSNLDAKITELSGKLEQLTSAVKNLQNESPRMKADIAALLSSRKLLLVRRGDDCPAGSRLLGDAGIIMPIGQYANNVGEGGGFNEEWRWTHPRLCSF